MKIKIFIIFLTAFIISCKTQDIIKEGMFVFKEKKTNIEQIQFNSDGTFIFTVWFDNIEWLSKEYSTCTGQWNYISKDTILIRSTDKVEYYEEFMPGYISKRIRKIVVINANKIKMEPTFGNPSDKIILRREVNKKR